MGADDAEVAAVEVAADGFEFFDDLGGADFGGAGDGAAGESSVEEVGEICMGS